MKRGQMKLSFGMIFSIILIVIFIAFSIYAIIKFLEIQDTTQVAKFTDNLQTDIDKMWRGSQGSVEKTYSVPKEIVYVCFRNYNSIQLGIKENLYNEFEQVYFEKENFFLYPIGSGQGLDSKEIKHVNLNKTTETENPYCITNTGGKVKLTIKKDFGEALVTVER
jgi:hypothetical protein